MSSTPAVRLALVLVLALIGPLLPGCTTEIAPPSRGEEVFTLWGQLDPTTERQALRVTPITQTASGEQDFDGVTVVSIDQTTGVETVWRDSVVTLNDDGPAHVFVADYRPAFDSQIEVQVRRDGEVVTYARTTAPPRVEPYFDGIRFGPSSFVDLVTIGAPRLVGGVIDYVVYPPNNPADVTVETFRIEQQQIQSIDTGWKARIPLSSHITDIINAVDARYPEDVIRTVHTCQVRFRISVVDQDWVAPFPLPFSRPLLLQPGTVSNVRNGYGYVGGGYTLDLRLEPTVEELNQLGLQARGTVPCRAAGY